METLDDLIKQHNTTYRTVSIRVSDKVFEWLKDMAARMKVSRAKLTELMFNHGYEHFICETKNGNGTGEMVEGDENPKFVEKDADLEVTATVTGVKDATNVTESGLTTEAAVEPPPPDATVV